MRFSSEILALSQDENVNIHYISGLEAFGLRGLRKLPALIKDTSSKALSLISGIEKKELVTIFVWVKKTKYSQAIVFPLWSHG